MYVPTFITLFSVLVEIKLIYMDFLQIPKCCHVIKSIPSFKSDFLTYTVMVFDFHGCTIALPAFKTQILRMGTSDDVHDYNKYIYQTFHCFSRNKQSSFNGFFQNVIMALKAISSFKSRLLKYNQFSLNRQ